MIFTIAGFILFSGYVYLQTGQNLLLKTYRDWFGLKGSSTVSEFRASSEGAKSYWLQKMCNNGRCLHTVDWMCGFSLSRMHPIEDHDPDVDEFDANVRRCFMSLAGKAPLTDTLDKLRLICGRHHMIFAGELYHTPQECAKVGGQWGARARVFADEDRYLE